MRKCELCGGDCCQNKGTETDRAYVIHDRVYIGPVGDECKVCGVCGEEVVWDVEHYNQTTEIRYQPGTKDHEQCY